MKLSYYVMVILYCAAIFYVSSKPLHIPKELDKKGGDKVAHGFIYAGLAALVSVGIRRSGRPVRPMVQFFVPVVFCAVYGASDEIHQFFVPYRSCALGDWLADVFGALLVQWLLCMRLWKLPFSFKSASE